jgi:hypothetical protein
VRPLVSPILRPGPVDGVSPSDAGVRRDWVAALGSPAVADLLRLMAAAHRGVAVKKPESLHVLTRENLVWWEGMRLAVPDRLPPLPDHTFRSLPLRVRRTLRPEPIDDPTARVEKRSRDELVHRIP